MSTGFVGASNVLEPAQPALPRLQTFEELGIADHFRKAVEAELTKDENVVWLGRPSRNPALYPNYATMMTAIGCVLLGVALVLGFAKFVPWFMAVFIGLFGLLFFGFVYLIRTGRFNPATTYQACYAVTNRRAMLIEMGTVGLEAGMFNPTTTRCKSYYPSEMLGLEARKHASEPGAGDLVFEYIFAVGKAVSSFPGNTGTVQRIDTPQRVPRGFFYLDQVHEVEQLVRKTLLGEVKAGTDAPAVQTSSASVVAKPAAGANALAASFRLGSPRATASAGVDALADSLRLRGSAETSDCREDGEIPDALKEKILADLAPNERAVWLAQPASAIVFRRNLAFLVVGGVFTLISLTWLMLGLTQRQAVPVAAAKKGAASQVRAPMPAEFSLGLPLALFVASVGGAVVPLVRVKLAQGSCYALTNRRALVYKVGLFGPTRESYSPSEVAKMRRSDSWLFKDGGDLIFSTVTTITTSSKGRSSVKTTYYGFLSIAHVKEVDKLVRETLINPFVAKLQAANAL